MNAESLGPVGLERNGDSPDKIQSLRDFEAWGMDDVEASVGRCLQPNLYIV
jgi:hypothetical protein